MIYTIHSKASRFDASGDTVDNSRFDGLVALPEGWAKWAIAAPPVWLAVHRLWFALMIYFMLIVLGLVLLTTPFALVGWLICVLPGLFLLLEGHQLRRARLEAEGLVLVAVVDAPDEPVAIARYLNSVSSPIENPTLPKNRAFRATGAAGVSDRPSNAAGGSFTLFPLEDH